jgi:hypothetical protein
MSFDPHMQHALNRRKFLQQTGLGFGGLALQSMLSAETGWTPPTGLPMHAPKAKSVIWLFMRGGVSHMESFDMKPALTQYAGKTIGETPYAFVQEPDRLKKVRVVVVNDANGQQRNKIYPLQVGSKRYGQSGIEVSDWFPHIGSCIDDIAVVRSMWTTDDNHGAQVQFHSGRHMLDPRTPTIGAWVDYGLGSLNENLPQFISMGPRFFDRSDGHYLGPAHDAIQLKIDPKNPLDFARPHGGMPVEEQRLGFDLVNRLNRLTAIQYPDDPALEARIKSYELAFRMQTSVPNIVDFDAESEATRTLYGFDQKETRPFGQQLLAARRFVEKGVRFIQIMHGDGAAGAWDQHSQLKANIRSLRCRSIVRLPACSRILNSAACWMKPSSSSPPSSAGHRAHRARMAGITIRMDSASGWPAAAYRVGSSKGPPTSWVSTPSKNRITSPTCTPRFCISSAFSPTACLFPGTNASRPTSAK